MKESRIMVVSLPAAESRRNELRRLFPASYGDFELVEAVDGRALSAERYFSYVKSYHNKYWKLLTPGEVGCSLSHMECYRRCESADHPALLLEDDIIGTDEGINIACALAKGISDKEVIFLGGQQGLPEYFRLRGRIVSEASGLPVYQIDKRNYRYLWRTCCYIVSPVVAGRLRALQEGGMCKADDWHIMLNRLGLDAIFVDIFEHPIEKMSGTIERERSDLAAVDKRRVAGLVAYKALSMFSVWWDGLFSRMSGATKVARADSHLTARRRK